MKKRLILLLALGALAGCGDSMTEPFLGCVSEGPEQVGRGRYGDYVYRECLRQEITCHAPLKLGESSGALVCKLVQ